VQPAVLLICTFLEMIMPGAMTKLSALVPGGIMDHMLEVAGKILINHPRPITLERTQVTYAFELLACHDHISWQENQ
jgi:anaerobic C4-dicarboxylate transporter